MGRRLGQHFLVRQSVLERIAEAACSTACGLVVEVGPGRGALTRHLISRAARVIGIEIDPVLVEYLRVKFREFPNVEIIGADILKTNIGQWGPLTIAGNLPYYITSPIVEKCLALRMLADRMVFLVQKEAAERLSAAPGSRDYGYLSVATQFFARAELLFHVPAAAFRPIPKVDSAVVRITPHAQLPAVCPEAFLQFAARCFAHKRKTLRNNLLPYYEREKVEALPEAGSRAEALSIAQLTGIFERITETPSS